MIPQSFIEEVQARTDIVELISSYIPLKRAGRNFKALCPFHNEKTPSFFVSPQKQIFHCFGCGEGGGPIQFLLLNEKVSFSEAVEILANRLGLKVPYTRLDKENLKTSLYEVVGEASLFFHNNLLKGRNSLNIINYLARRGIDKEAIKRFRLGFAEGSHTLLNYLRGKGFTLKILEKASLIISQGDSFRDFFSQRIIFPIFDSRNRVVGFGARRVREDNSPKYINSLDNPLYSKREHLFGLNLSKDEIGKQNSAIVVEGYLDMISPFIKGIKNIVASLGTALTEEQIRLIKRYTNNIILIFDPDKSGQVATLKALDLILKGGLKVAIVQLPEGYDPDSLVREKGERVFRDYIKESKDFFDYKLGILKNIYDINTIEGKSKIAKEIFITLQNLESEIARFEYIKKLGYILKVKEEILIAEFRKFNSSRRERNYSINNNFNLQKEPLSITEKIVLKFLLTSPRLFSQVGKGLREEDFNSLLARKTISYLSKNFSWDNMPSKLIGSVEDKEISSFISRILMDDDIPLDKELFKSSLEKLLKNRIKLKKDKLREEIKEAEKRGDSQRLKGLIKEYSRLR